MKFKENTPRLRFKEFNDKWEQKAIGPLIDLLSGFPFNGIEIIEDSKGTLLMRGANITDGRIRHNAEIDRYYGGEVKLLSKYFLEEGDVIIGMDGSKVGKNSAIVDYANSKSLLVQRVARIRAKKGTCQNFIYNNISSFRFHVYVDTVKTNSGIPHISAQDIKGFTIFLPSFPEQQKIAAFLTAVDDKIQQLIRKKKLLEQYKKGCMQQIFSQTIRFKDDSGKAFPEWEISKLDNVGDINGGGTPDTGIPEYWNGSINWFTPTEIKSKYINKSIRTITELGLRNSSAKILPRGTLLLSSRATVGDIGIALNECSTNQGFQSIVVNERNINEYIYYWIVFNKQKFLSKASGSTFLEINKTEISKLKIKLPSKKNNKK